MSPVPLPPDSVSPWGVDAMVQGLTAEPFVGSRSFSYWGYGGSLRIGAHWRDFPLELGLEMGGIRWPEARSSADVLLGGSRQRLTETRSDQSGFLGPWFRLEPPRWAIRPYIEGAFDLVFLDTRYAFALQNGAGQTSATTDQASAFGGGFGFGLEILLARTTAGPDAGLYVTLGYRKHWGSNASFTRAPDSSSVNQTLSFDVPTNTNLLLLGFALHAR